MKLDTFAQMHQTRLEGASRVGRRDTIKRHLATLDLSTHLQLRTVRPVNRKG
jgi:hypothetical protein